MKAMTFFADRPEIEVEIIDRIGKSDMYRVRYGIREMARHRDRLQPIDDEAKKLLGKKN